MILEIDFETRSDVDIRKRGAYVYFESPHTQPLMASYRIGDGPLQRWRPQQFCPMDIINHVQAGGTIRAHNAAFERLLWQKILTPCYGWPQVGIEQFVCTAATAAALALPRSLEGLGEALDLSVQKDKEGSRLIRWFSVPRAPRRNQKIQEPPGLYFHEPEEFPEEFERFHDYCDQDVLAEADAAQRMVPLSTYEQELYWLDQKINDRGLGIDVRSVNAALEIIEAEKHRLDREIWQATDGFVKTTSSVQALTEWVQLNGGNLENLARADVDEMLESDDGSLPDNVRQVLEIRREAAKTSTAKLKAFQQRVCADGSVRGSFLFCGASTRRWSSTGVQLHNLPRPRKEFADAQLDLDTLFDAIRVKDPGYLHLLYGDDLGRALPLLSDAIRGFIRARPGRELLVADYSGIEGAVAAWFAGERWKVEALHEIIADPSLPDLYRRAAAGIYNVDASHIGKRDRRRQVGKVAELALQYQGGVGAFRTMAQGYGLKLDPVFNSVWEAASDARCEAAAIRYEECLKRNDPTTRVMTKREWIAAELVKVGWRATHPAIRESWRALQDATMQAVANPGTQVDVLKCSYKVAHGFLWCRLPSGGCLAYGAPHLRWVEAPWADQNAEATKREKQLCVTAAGTDSVTKKWSRFALYGGLAFENIVQAIARDLLAHGMLAAEATGYPVIGHVHDEIITEVPKSWGSVTEFESLICKLPEWANGLPLIASGWRGSRYRKE